MCLDFLRHFDILTLLVDYAPHGSIVEEPGLKIPRESIEVRLIVLLPGDSN